MNAQAAASALRALIGSYAVHPAMIAELVEIIAQSGYEKRIFNLLITRLKLLSMYGPAAITKLPSQFELLKHSNLYENCNNKLNTFCK